MPSSFENDANEADTIHCQQLLTLVEVIQKKHLNRRQGSSYNGSGSPEWAIHNILEDLFPFECIPRYQASPLIHVHYVMNSEAGITSDF